MFKSYRYILVIGVCLCLQMLATDAYADENPKSEQPLDIQINTLIEKMLQADTEQQAFANLETLGKPAVPYIVGHLSDARPLPVHSISLRNHAQNAFEAYRHYSPETVHDALSAILNQLTGTNFEFVYNGAEPEIRNKNTIAWHNWCNKNYPKQQAICAGENLQKQSKPWWKFWS